MNIFYIYVLLIAIYFSLCQMSYEEIELNFGEDNSNKMFIRTINETHVIVGTEKNIAILDLVNMNNSNRYKRDFYMSVILALREYIKRGDFENANIILTTSESSACFNNPNNISETSCGCPITKNDNNIIKYLEEIVIDDLVLDNT